MEARGHAGPAPEILVARPRDIACDLAAAQHQVHECLANRSAISAAGVAAQGCIGCRHRGSRGRWVGPTATPLKGWPARRGGPAGRCRGARAPVVVQVFGRVSKRGIAFSRKCSKA